MLNDPTISEADLRQHYARTRLARYGISFETAMTIETVRIALVGAVKAARRVAALRARDNAIEHQVAA